MIVKELIEFLKTCDENKIVVGQYHDSLNDSWPLGDLEIFTVGGRVVIQVYTCPLNEIPSGQG